MSLRKEKILRSEEALDVNGAAKKTASEELTDEQLDNVAAGSVANHREEQLKQYRKRVKPG